MRHIQTPKHQTLSPSDRKRFDSVPWVKLKERNFDIALESLYSAGHIACRAPGMDRRIGCRGVGCTNTIALSDNRLFYDPREIAAMRSLFSNHPDVGGYAKKLTRLFIANARHYQRFTRANEYRAFHTLSKTQLLNFYREAAGLIYPLIPYALLVSVALEDVAEEHIGAYLKNPRHYNELIQSQRPTKFSNENTERHRLAMFVGRQKNKDAPAVTKAIRSHLKKYAWLVCHSPIDLPISEMELRQSLSSLEKQKQLKKQLHRHALAHNIWKTPPPTTIRTLIAVMRQNVWVRTWRREVLNEGFFRLQGMYQNIAERMRIPFSDLKHYACWEIEEFLRTGRVLSNKEVTRRNQCFAELMINGKQIILSGPRATKLTIPTENSSALTTLSGKTVFPGVAEGRVCILRAPEDIRNVVIGDILVAPTLNVWATPILNRCVGIITDEGGVLSHAALIAREHQLPCIIGTRTATAHLRTGMRVRLNANTGTITIVF